MWKRELSSSLKTTSPVYYVLTDKDSKLNYRDFCYWWESYVFWYLQPPRPGWCTKTSKLSSLLHCPSSQKTCGNFTTFQFNRHSSWDWSSSMYLFHPTFIDCYYIFLMFFYLWLLRPLAKLFFYIAFIGSACITLSRCARQKHYIDLVV